MLKKFIKIFRKFVWEPLPNEVKNLYHLLPAIAAVIYYKYPARNLTVVGVTGTDGKTTTASLIYHILQSSGKKVGLVTSIEALIDNQSCETGLHTTTPSTFALQKFLKQMVDSGCKYVVLEVTSHGLDQHRVLGCNFKIGVLTNVTNEHLDYHKTYEKYLAAKTKLLKQAKIAIINKDDGSYKKIVDNNQQLAGKLKTYGIDTDADFKPSTLGFVIKTQLPGKYNVYNILAATAVVKTLGVDSKLIAESIASFQPPQGRFEEVKNEYGLNIVIDFAHTPNALESLLKNARELVSQSPVQHPATKIITVFGCAGERDREKRPVMGEIAARCSDVVILTAEDPRTEDVNNIIEEIAQGCQPDAALFKIPDRQEAINYAIQTLAKKGDWVLLCGKGHEKSMCYGSTERPWSEREAVTCALNGKI